MAPLSPRTQADYRADWNAFLAWLGETASPGAEPTPDAVARYLLDRAGLEGGADRGGGPRRSQRGASGGGARPLSTGALRRIRAAIDAVAQGEGRPIPSEHPAVREAWERILRADRGEPERSGLRVLDDLFGFELKEMASAVAGTDSLLALRDRVLLLVGAGAALTPSQLCALRVEDVAVEELLLEELLLEELLPEEREQIAREEMGPTVSGAVLAVGLPEGGAARLWTRRPELDAVEAFRTWVSAAGVKQGPLLRGVDRHGRVGRGALRTGSISLAMRRLAELAGLDEPDTYSGLDLVQLALPQEDR